MPNNNNQAAQRLTKYSAAIAQCSTYCTTYAKCIVQNTENLKKDNCVKEFNQFKDCVKNVNYKILNLFV